MTKCEKGMEFEKRLHFLFLFRQWTEWNRWAMRFRFLWKAPLANGDILPHHSPMVDSLWGCKSGCRFVDCIYLESGTLIARDVGPEHIHQNVRIPLKLLRSRSWSVGWVTIHGDLVRAGFGEHVGAFWWRNSLCFGDTFNVLSWQLKSTQFHNTMD